MLTSIVAAVLIFGLLIVIHEAGHFFVAKGLGVRVLRFSIGYPPRIWGIRRGETDYAIGATPLGGYVRMLGDEVADDPSSESVGGYLEELKADLLQDARATGWLTSKGLGDDDALNTIAAKFTDKTSDESSDAARMIPIIGRAVKKDEALLLREIDRSGSIKLAQEKLVASRPSALIEAFKERAFPSQSLARRFAIVLAGPAANILFAPVLMIIVFMVGLPTPLPVLGTVDTSLPGYAAGLRPGDQITAVNGQAIDTWDDFSRMVKASNGEPLALTLKRSDQGAARILQLRVRPKMQTVPTIYGDSAPTWIIGVRPSGLEVTRRLPPFAAMREGVVETWRMSVSLFIGIAKIIEGVTPAREALGGPIMIAQIAGKEVHQGFADVALFMVTISLELGVINLLPVPLLDGGHLMFFTIEAVRGSPLKLRHREIAMQVGLFLLAILMAFVILNDISRLVG